MLMTDIFSSHITVEHLSNRQSNRSWASCIKHLRPLKAGERGPQRLQLVNIDDPVHKQVKILFHTLACLFNLSNNYLQWT